MRYSFNSISSDEFHKYQDKEEDEENKGEDKETIAYFHAKFNRNEPELRVEITLNKVSDLWCSLDYFASPDYGHLNDTDINMLSLVVLALHIN